MQLLTSNLKDDDFRVAVVCNLKNGGAQYDTFKVLEALICCSMYLKVETSVSLVRRSKDSIITLDQDILKIV